VTGAAGEIPPLELVRQTQDPMTLRLLIDMYHVHDLPEEGGIVRRSMWKKYDRIKVGECAQFTVWGFRLSNECMKCESCLTDPHCRKLTDEEKVAGHSPGVDFF
jgi:hypothetical protein